MQKKVRIKKNDTISDKLGDWYASEYGIFKRVGFGYLGLGEFYLNFGALKDATGIAQASYLSFTVAAINSAYNFTTHLLSFLNSDDKYLL